VTLVTVLHQQRPDFLFKELNAGVIGARWIRRQQGQTQGAASGNQKDMAMSAEWTSHCANAPDSSGAAGMRRTHFNSGDQPLHAVSRVYA
jgi:hypothetical protein